ncbi:hypothetical protein [Petrachloros mirabilis]
MSEKYTTGPWRISNEYPTIIKRDYRSIGSEDGELLAIVLANSNSGYFVSEAEALSNARLIAAAPELLDACKKALYALKGREHAQFLRDAIAKATGTQP